MSIRHWGISEWGSLASIVSMGLLFYINFGRRPDGTPIAHTVLGAASRPGFGRHDQRHPLLDFHTHQPLGIVTTYYDGRDWRWIATSTSGVPLGNGKAQTFDSARRDASIHASRRVREGKA